MEIISLVIMPTLKFISNHYNDRFFQWAVPEKGNKFIDNCVYPFLSRMLDCNDPKKITVSASYWLTDLFDKNHEFDKAAELSRKVLRHIPKDSSAVFEIRMIIGSWYSIFKNVRKKKDNQKFVSWCEDIINAEKVYEQIENSKRIELINDDTEKAVLLSLFESDYGGLFLNKFKAFDEPEYLVIAKTHYENARKIRAELCRKNPKYKKEYYTTLGSIATVQYYQGNYDEAIHLHNKALSYFAKHNEKQSVINTKRLITGCFEKESKKALNTGIALSNDDISLCISYLKECIEYYKGNADLLDEVQRRLEYFESEYEAN